MASTRLAVDKVSIPGIIQTWWPLAASWLLMMIEIPALSAVMARMANPEINLAAYGGIVYPVALIIEAPIIMLLSASTALCHDRSTFQQLYRFMMIAGAALTLLHVVIAFTPLYYFIARQLIGVPEKVIEPARLGLMLILPWSWSIGYRRFHQGVLISHGHSDAVGVGTILRLAGDAVVLLIGFLWGNFPGVAVAAASQAVGVVSEAAYIGIRVRPVLRYELSAIPPKEKFSWRGFARFYIPLAMTSYLGLLWQPLGSAALSRMPDPLTSLAVWPVVSGLINIFRGFGYALNEVVVATLDKARSYFNLRKFVYSLAASVTLFQIVVLVTPLAGIWFRNISALSPALASAALAAFGYAIPMAGFAVFQSWFQGAIINGRRPRAIPEATAIFVAVFSAIAILGIVLANTSGLLVGIWGFVMANLAQTAWLWYRSRGAMAEVKRRDANEAG